MFTWLDINSNAIKYNLRQFKKIVGPKVQIMPVIKANAYGHGFLEVAKICDQAPETNRICVVNCDEALELITHKIKKPIVILTFFDTKNTEKALILAKKDTIFPLYSLKQAHFLNRIGDRARKKIRVHIKVDTGASRVGLLAKDVLPFIKKIRKMQRIEIEGLYSHFASSEEDRVFTEHQMMVFNDLSDKIKNAGIKIPIQHFACSAAGILYSKSRMNAVRVGLSIYGLYPDELSRKKINLRPALSWHTKIIQVRTVPAWTKIGYGGSYTTKKSTKLATLPVGYWDGYDRSLSNNGLVLIKGVHCHIRGRICMNICMVDVSSIKNVKAGDIATLIGTQKGKSITADDMAKWAKTINYEIVTRINPTILRVYR